MKDMITTSEGFQYSINIDYDLGKEDKLENFIATNFTINFLEEILLSTDSNSTDRARVLIGSYGKGKSHIILTILSILLKKDLSLFKKLTPKVKENSKLNQLIENYYESNNKILPVVINGSDTNLTQAFLISLQQTLSKYGLQSIMPKTSYKAAVETIERWKEDYVETYNKFKNKIEEPVDTFLERLDNFDHSAYTTFEKIYPDLTAGSVFNPFLNSNIVDLYESVAESLKDKGFSGIYVVYDEFSKYLEANITDASVNDIKMLQDFAEKCNRSGELQLHLLLISHKEISNYIDKLPKEKTDGWRGVSERFKHVRLDNNFSQMYEEIIPSVINHNEPLWGHFQRIYSKEFNNLTFRYRNHEMFKDEPDEIVEIIKNCFPLHPVSTFILPRLSERVAQNERTLFTFLSADGSDTLNKFLESYNNDFTLITPDKIYDYFEPLLKKEVYSGDIHDLYILTSKILSNLEEDSLESKIVKSLSLFYILNQFERLKPTKEEILGIYSNDYSYNEIEEAISNLIEKELVVYLKRSNNCLKLKQTSGENILQKISDLIEKQSGKVASKDILNKSNFDNYMFPSRYNDENYMTRYFAFQFISADEVDDQIDWDIKSETINADGVIYGIVPDNPEQLGRLLGLIQETSKDNDRIIFVIPKNYREISQIINQYNAVSQLRDKAVDDPVLFDEYQVIFEDLQEILNNYIRMFTHPEMNQAVYIYKGEKLNIHRKSELSELMSRICDDVYSQTPIINNEVINKNEITSIAQNNRNKIVSALLRNELEPKLGFTGRGQEISIMRSTLIRTGILKEEDGLVLVELHPDDPKMRNMLGTIEDFIFEARTKGKAHFSDLYDRLTLPEFHIGLRSGVIPIYLAAVLHNYRQEAIITDHFGPVQTSMDVLVQLNNNPSDYTLEFLDWNPEKENYISQLEKEFSNYVEETEKIGNSYDYVANAIHRWYMALPKYSKESRTKPDGEKLLKEQIRMIRLLRENSSSYELLFKKLPKVFNCNDQYSEIAESIIKIKQIYEGLLNDLKQYLIEKTKSEFFIETKNNNREITLLDLVQDWCNELDPKIFEQLFNDGTDRFLSFIRKPTNDIESFITQLGKLVTGLRLEDWNNKTINTYFENLSRFIKSAKEFHSDLVTERANETSGYELVFLDDEGTSTVKRFDSIEISNLGKLLFNQINASLDAMGQSIPEQEKRQVLMEILKELC